MAQGMINPQDANGVVEAQLDGLLGQVAAAFKGDALTWNGPIMFGADTAVRRVIEARRQVDNSDRLAILLTSTGGIVEVVQRIVETIRHHYDHVDFVIPDYAFSAGHGSRAVRRRDLHVLFPARAD